MTAPKKRKTHNLPVGAATLGGSKVGRQGGHVETETPPNAGRAAKSGGPYSGIEHVLLYGDRIGARADGVIGLYNGIEYVTSVRAAAHGGPKGTANIFPEV